MGQKAMLINYEFCTGCRACEVACQQEYGYDEDKTGITLYSQGPFRINARKWNWNWIATPTDICHGCAGRVTKGKLPTCQQHCQAKVIQVGELEDLAPKMSKKHALFCIG